MYKGTEQTCKNQSEKMTHFMRKEKYIFPPDFKKYIAGILRAVFKEENSEYLHLRTNNL